jgi:hypothetical protein
MAAKAISEALIPTRTIEAQQPGLSWKGFHGSMKRNRWAHFARRFI